MAIGAFRQGETVPDLCANQPVSRVLANPFLGENAAILRRRVDGVLAMMQPRAANSRGRRRAATI